MEFNFEKILGKSIDELEVGDEASFAKTITEADVSLFCGVVGDFNPLLVNDRYAKVARYTQRIVPGLLVASLISNVVGNFLPGPGAIYASQDLDFINPVFIGDTIKAIVHVESVIPERNRIKIRTYCLNQFKEIVVDGTAIVLPAPKKTSE